MHDSPREQISPEEAAAITTAANTPSTVLGGGLTLQVVTQLSLVYTRRYLPNSCLKPVQTHGSSPPALFPNDYVCLDSRLPEPLALSTQAFTRVDG